MKPLDIFEGQHDGCNDAGDKHYDPKDTEKALTLGEVHLCLEAEDCYCDADDSSDSQSEKHCFCVIVTGNGSSHVGQSQGKDEQQHDVPWELPPGALAADQHKVGDEIHSIRCPVDSWVSLDEQSDRSDKCKYSHNGGSDKQL